MKAVKANLVNSFNFGTVEQRMKTGTELFILGKWEDSGSKSGVTYLTYRPEKKQFRKLDAGHLKLQEKEPSILELPTLTFGEVNRKKEIGGHITVSLSPQLILPKSSKTTFGKYKDEAVIVIASIVSDEYPSGAGYIISEIKPAIGENPIMVDAMEIELLEIGNMVQL